MASKKKLKTGHRQCALCKAPADTKYCSSKCKHAHTGSKDVHDRIVARMTITERMLQLGKERERAMPWDRKAIDEQIALLQLELAEIHEFAREK